jgi:hypothetical protein
MRSFIICTFHNDNLWALQSMMNSASVLQFLNHIDNR